MAGRGLRLRQRPTTFSLTSPGVRGAGRILTVPFGKDSCARRCDRGLPCPLRPAGSSNEWMRTAAGFQPLFYVLKPHECPLGHVLQPPSASVTIPDRSLHHRTGSPRRSGRPRKMGSVSLEIRENKLEAKPFLTCHNGENSKPAQ